MTRFHALVFALILIPLTACGDKDDSSEPPEGDTDTDTDTDSDSDSDSDSDTDADSDTDPFDMVLVPAGSFDMGCTAGQQGLCSDNEYPLHTVEITRAFFIGVYEVTQDEWESTMGTNPSTFDSCGGDCPVDTISWIDAVTFANALTGQQGLTPCYEIDGEDVQWEEGLDCDGYRLATEAEWEYAARAGDDLLYAGADSLGSVGWYENNSTATSHPVGLKPPNAWGLYDMSGNAWEVVWDYNGDYPSGSVVDPTGPASGSVRGCRGGAFDYPDSSARVASRGVTAPINPASNDDLGLRLVRTAP